jgi:protein SCO1/2
MTTTRVMTGVLVAIGIAAGAATATRTRPAGEARDAAIARPADKATTRTGVRRLKKGDALPEFALTNDAGRPFTSADLRGHVTVVTFMFTRCPVPEFCPLMAKRFQQLQRNLEAEPSLRHVRLLGITLDPAFDRPEVLHAYAAAMGADPARWQFLTGTPEEVARLTSAFSIHVERNGALLDHTLATALIDADGRITDFWRGNGWTTAEVTDALRRVTRHETE